MSTSDPSHDLFVAAETGNFPDAMDALARGADVTRVYGRAGHSEIITALYRAVQLDHADIAEAILKHCKNPQQADCQLHAGEAFRRGALKSLSVLLSHAKETMPANKYQACLGELLSGADVTETTPEKQAEAIKILLNLGADPRYEDGERKTILERLLSTSPNIAAINTVIRGGANIGTTSEGQSLLQSAIDKGLVEGVECMLERGDTPGYQELIDQAIHGMGLNDCPAAKRIRLIHLLAAKGANINHPGEGGYTALLDAVHRQSNPPEVIEGLVDAGANLSAKCIDGDMLSYADDRHKPLIHKLRVREELRRFLATGPSLPEALQVGEGRDVYSRAKPYGYLCEIIRPELYPDGVPQLYAFFLKEISHERASHGFPGNPALDPQPGYIPSEQVAIDRMCAVLKDYFEASAWAGRERQALDTFEQMLSASPDYMKDWLRTSIDLSPLKRGINSPPSMTARYMKRKSGEEGLGTERNPR